MKGKRRGEEGRIGERGGEGRGGDGGRNSSFAVRRIEGGVLMKVKLRREYTAHNIDERARMCVCN